jgi:branched-chain amino acid aminotransferase
MNPSLRVEAHSDPARALEGLSAELAFGQRFADLMVRARHTSDQGWHDLAVVPFGPLALSPAAKVLHYGLEVFEGLKAYAWPADEVGLFRPELNAQRLNRSAARLTMPEIPEALQLDAMLVLVDLLRAWVPRAPGTSLYLRPALIGTEACLGVGPAAEHLYLVIASPVAAYFAADAEGIPVWIEEHDARAFPGGVGAAKAGGNYAAGLQAQIRAKKNGFAQVLFLDGLAHRWLEEMNGMNVFAVVDQVLVTPPLGDTILDGITRRSLLDLAPALGIEAEQRPLPIDQVVADLEAGRMTELFTAGTGAGITPIGRLGFRDRRLRVGAGGLGPVAASLKEALSGIQTGRRPDPFGWTRRVPRQSQSGVSRVGRSAAQVGLVKEA